MTVDDSDISLRRKPYSGRTSRTGFGGGDARGPIIDQDGREVPPESVRDGFREFRLDFGSANPFGNLSRVIPLRGPGQISFDVSMFKTFTIAEKIKAVMGKRVAVDYEEHIGLITSCFGDTGHFVKDVKVIDETPAPLIIPGQSPTPLPTPQQQPTLKQ